MAVKGSIREIKVGEMGGERDTAGSSVPHVTARGDVTNPRPSLR